MMTMTDIWRQLARSCKVLSHDNKRVVDLFCTTSLCVAEFLHAAIWFCRAAVAQFTNDNGKPRRLKFAADIRCQVHQVVGVFGHSRFGTHVVPTLHPDEASDLVFSITQRQDKAWVHSGCHGSSLITDCSGIASLLLCAFARAIQMEASSLTTSESTGISLFAEMESV